LVGFWEHGTAAVSSRGLRETREDKVRMVAHMSVSCVVFLSFEGR